MNKFSVERIGKIGERLGFWELPNHAAISSPGLWLTTSATGIPNLTPETFEMSCEQKLFSGLLVPYEKHARSIDVYEAYGKGFLAFSGLPRYPTLISVLDPVSETRSGFSTSKSISVWGECDQRHCVEIDEYLKGIRLVKKLKYSIIHLAYVFQSTNVNFDRFLPNLN